VGELTLDGGRCLLRFSSVGVVTTGAVLLTRNVGVFWVLFNSRKVLGDRRDIRDGVDSHVKFVCALSGCVTRIEGEAGDESFVPTVYR
jgi:hypothetical protein